MKTIATFCHSPMPSQSMVSGIQVMDGSGRSSDTNGSTMALAGHHTPIRMPSGIATTAASAKPANTRCDDISTAVHSSPLPTILPASASTARGEGRNTGATQPSSVATVHRPRKASTDTTLRISDKPNFSADASALRRQPARVARRWSHPSPLSYSPVRSPLQSILYRCASLVTLIVATLA